MELLFGPEDSNVDLRFIVMNARRKKGCRIFEIFGSQGQIEFLVVSASRWGRRLTESLRRKEEYEENTVMQARQEELGKVIKNMSERQEKLLAIIERKNSLLSEATEDLRKQIFQTIRELDDRIYKEVMELLEKQQNWKKC